MKYPRKRIDMFLPNLNLYYEHVWLLWFFPSHNSQMSSRINLETYDIFKEKS